jgi:NAD(P)-dependent dehydrogenase (short-subunit alcohol dehydrogenase family)
MPAFFQDNVVVITVASNGIGRATAHAFANAGATVVLAARSEATLRDAAECKQPGCKTLVVPTDVTGEGAVSALARLTRTTFGHIDIWVNDAAVTVFGVEGQKLP